MESLAVEICQPHSPTATILHRHELLLNGPALRVPPAPPALADGSRHLHKTSKVCVAPSEFTLNFLMDGPLQLRPVWIHLCDLPGLFQQCRSIHGRRAPRGQQARHVRVQHSLCVLLVQDAGKRQPQHNHGFAQMLRRRLSCQVLEQHCNEGDTLGAEARSIHLLLDNSRHVLRGLGKQGDLGSPSAIPSLALGVQANKGPATDPHEEPVQRIAHRGGAEAAIRLRGQRGESWLQRRLELWEVPAD
mmetsp:Transcript_58410/g.170829  ORF Transcript_58410/g.170829 Transcript_58410/m.170829 type:complete len:246 (+) Transcript_58410:862-1599(+)